MSAITNVWRQLVQRRLWPVAILLIAALAGVPLALAEEPAAPAPAAPLPTADGDAALAAQPIVAQASAADRGKRRKVLGTRKNPFGLPKEEPSASAAAPNSTGSTTAQEPRTPAPSGSGGTTPSSGGGAPSTGGGAPSSGGGSPSTGGGPSAPPATEPTPKPEPRKYAMHELTVRFGDATSGDLARRTLERLQPLPSAEQPVLIYLGVLKDGETAVFLLDHGVQAIGDGDCRPTPEQCETIRLRAGETEFLDVVDAEGNVSAQYQLDLIKIHKSRTTSATRAKASSKAGQRLLKARVASDGPTGYSWDAAAGALERRPGRTLRATVESQTVSLP
jgi:hypothetical protein